MTLEDEIIDYKLLVDAINFYTKIGYSQIEIPWIVSSSASMETCPSIKYVYHADLVNEHFVGSAEQGFIQLIKNKSDKLVPDKGYFAVSPCFRRETPDELHSRWFIKLELFVLSESLHAVPNLIFDASMIHKEIFNDRNDEIAIIRFDDGTMDLVCREIEFGSYGARIIDGRRYCYGTGLALPRAQLLKSLNDVWTKEEIDAAKLKAKDILKDIIFE